MRAILQSLILLMIATIAMNIAHAQQRTVQSVHREGVALFDQGKYAEALQRFQLVLKHQPSYVYAKVYASKCELAIKQNKGSSSADIQGTLSKVTIPTVAFEEVPLSDVLGYIRQRTEELTGGKVTPNIIFSGSAEQRGTKVTMKLNNVPVTTLLKYVGDQTRCRVRYDAHAVMVTPIANLPPEPALEVKPKETNPFEKQPAAPNPFK